MRHQYHHCTDIVPTILDCCGVEFPEVVAGVKQEPLVGLGPNHEAEGKMTLYVDDKAVANGDFKIQTGHMHSRVRASPSRPTLAIPSAENTERSLILTAGA